jgi:hypothetical protein
LNANRDAAAASLLTLASPPSKSLLLLADILVTGGASTLSAGVIRDRRRYCTEGGVSALIGAGGNDPYLEVAVPRAHSSAVMRAQNLDPATYGGSQAACLVFLDRPISANKLIFNYRIDASTGTPGPTANFMAGVCDASGRVIFNANNQALSTATGRYQNVMTMPTTFFDAGAYWYAFGISTASANGANSIDYYGACGNVSTGGINGAVVSAPNVFLVSSSGGSVFPSSKTILGYVDAYVSGLTSPSVPMFVLAR